MLSNVNKCEVLFNIYVQCNPYLHDIKKVFLSFLSLVLCILNLQSNFNFTLNLFCINWVSSKRAWCKFRLKIPSLCEGNMSSDWTTKNWENFEKRFCPCEVSYARCISCGLNLILLKLISHGLNLPLVNTHFALVRSLFQVCQVSQCSICPCVG